MSVSHSLKLTELVVGNVKQIAFLILNSEPLEQPVLAFEGHLSFPVGLLALSQCFLGICCAPADAWLEGSREHPGHLHSEALGSSS